jgi:hypothetical protein
VSADPFAALQQPTLVLGRLLPGRCRHQLATPLLERGLPVEHIQQDEPIEPGRAGLVLMWGAPGWYPRAVRSLLELPSRPRVVLWHTEPLPLPAAAGLPNQRRSVREWAKIALRDTRVSDAHTNLQRLVRLARRGFPDVLIVPYAASAKRLAEHGLHAHVIPIGSGARHCVDHGLERDLDVVFLGLLDVPRRRRLVRRMGRAGLDIVVRGSWSDPAFWGDERGRLLNRTKILLSFGRFAGQLPGHRFLVGMGAGSLVLSEPVYRPEPFVAGEHYVSAELDELAEVARHYLTHENERAAIAARGRRFVCEQLTMGASLERLASLC